jgi:predicted O-methyltransferase YrrM
MISFTTDWVTSHEMIWAQTLGKFINEPDLKAIEIGVFEGRSSIWFLSHILTHPSSTIVCIDPYYKPVFHTNIQPFVSQVRLIKEQAQIALRDKTFPLQSFDFIYLDGDHKARATLENAVLCFRLLRHGGILIFDDYLWKSSIGEDELLNPKIAIDCFLKIYQSQYRLLHKGKQIIIERIITGRL